MNEINLDRYLTELLTLWNFYNYSERVFQSPGVREQLSKQEIQVLTPLAAQFVEAPDQLKLLQDQVPASVAKHVDGGLVILRRQMLEAAHSIFEKYLCHIVRVYIYTFPEVLKASGKQVSFIKVAELKDNGGAIFDYAVEREVGHFSRLNLEEKKNYLAKRLKHTGQDELWAYKGEELWRDIDKKRQAIVHEDETPEISNEYLARAVYYLERLMVGMAFEAQSKQGVKFKWMVFSQFANSKETPALK